MPFKEFALFRMKCLRGVSGREYRFCGPGLGAALFVRDILRHINLICFKCGLENRIKYGDTGIGWNSIQAIVSKALTIKQEKGETMKNTSRIVSLIVVVFIVLVCMAGVSYAADNTAAIQTEAKIALHQHHDRDGCSAGHVDMAQSGITVQYAQNIPEPNCVCAGCGKKCGTGHTSSCPYRPKSK